MLMFQELEEKLHVLTLADRDVPVTSWKLGSWSIVSHGSIGRWWAIGERFIMIAHHLHIYIYIIHIMIYLYIFMHIYIIYIYTWFFECPSKIEVAGKTPLHLSAQWGTVDVALPLGETMKCVAMTLFLLLIVWLTIWLFNSLPWKITIFKNGKPSISMGHLYHGYVSHNQRVTMVYCRYNWQLIGVFFNQLKTFWRTIL